MKRYYFDKQQNYKQFKDLFNRGSKWLYIKKISKNIIFTLKYLLKMFLCCGINHRDAFNLDRHKFGKKHIRNQNQNLIIDLLNTQTYPEFKEFDAAESAYSNLQEEFEEPLNFGTQDTRSDDNGDIIIADDSNSDIFEGFHTSSNSDSDNNSENDMMSNGDSDRDFDIENDLSEGKKKNIHIYIYIL